jgi:hypothetical protein
MQVVAGGIFGDFYFGEANRNIVKPFETAR